MHNETVCTVQSTYCCTSCFSFHCFTCVAKKCFFFFSYTYLLQFTTVLVIDRQNGEPPANLGGIMAVGAELCWKTWAHM